MEGEDMRRRKRRKEPKVRVEREPEPTRILVSRVGKGATVHLREEVDGGLLVIGGSKVAHLNATAFDIYWHFLSGENITAIVRSVTKKYKVRKSIVKDDLKRLQSYLTQIEEGKFPEGAKRAEPLSGGLISPLRADIALTYKMSSGGSGEAGSGELDAREWTKILDVLWREAVPHICFTGGEPTAREDLVDLISHADSKGMTVGLLTDGQRCGSKKFMERLQEAGLNYLQVSIASQDPDINSKILGTPFWNRSVAAIKHAVTMGIPVIGEILVTKDNEYDLDGTVRFLDGLGVRTLTCHTIPRMEKALGDQDMALVMKRARQSASPRTKVMWFGPTRAPAETAGEDEEGYGDLALGNVEWGAGRISLFIGPDGNAYPGRGHPVSVGNPLTHSWTMIWNHSACKEIREMKIEEKRWNSMESEGFYGYPLFPDLKQD
jgi:MoaA/NifB/PqqE/SkfB family radical SAM enzyme